MAYLYLNDDGDLMISDGNLQDIINQYSVDGTGDISDLNLPTSGEWSSEDYEEGSDWFISTQEEEIIMEQVFTLQQLIDDGLGVEDLKNDFTILELLLAGFTMLELYQGGITAQELITYGYTIKQLIDGGVNDIPFILNISVQETTLVENIVTDINNEFFIDTINDIYITEKDNNKILKVPASITTVAAVTDSSWTQLGEDIVGEAADNESGYSVSLNGDGTIVAIGAPKNTGVNGADSGHVRVYQYASGSWSQLGDDIDGEAAGDESGFSVSLSNDGTILAIGAPKSDENGADSGHVRIYQYSSGSDQNTTNLTTSSQVNIISSGGNKYVFNGETTYDSSKKYGLQEGTYTFTNVPQGHPIAILNDGNANISYTGDSDKKFTKAVTGTTNDGTYDFYYGDVTVTVTGDFGTVSVYCYYHGYMGGENLLVHQSASGSYSWSQKGYDIGGDFRSNNSDESGLSVSLSSDGSIVAIGAPKNASNKGHIRLYRWREFLASDINSDGDILDFNYVNQRDSGFYSDLPIIITSSDGTAPLAGTYYWTQMGLDIDGDVAGDEYGHQVSLNGDGTIVAIGAYNHDGNKGHVRVHQYSSNDDDWTQLGSDIDGEAAGDESGFSVSLSNDGTKLAIGAPKNDGNKGHVRVYQYSNNSWTQLGSDIDGEAASDESGFSVSLNNSGATIAISSHGTAAGKVKIHNLQTTEISPASTTISYSNSSDFITSDLNEPSGIVKRSDGKFFVSNKGNDTIILFDENGDNGIIYGGHKDNEGDNNGINYIVSENNEYDIKISSFNTNLNNPGKMLLQDNNDILFIDNGSGKLKNLSYSSGSNTYNQNDIIYIANTNSHTISRYFNNILSEWIGKDGESGNVDGNITTTRLNKPGAIFVEQKDNIDYVYFLDRGNNSLKVINTDYPVNCTKIVDGLNNPHGFMKDGDDFYIADTDNNKIVKIEKQDNDSYTSSDFATNMTSPKDIVKRGTTFYVSCGDHTIKKMESNGSFFTISGVENNSGITNDLDTILDNGHIVQTSLKSQYNNPNQLFIDSSNDLLIVDEDNDKIRHLEIADVVTSVKTGIYYLTQGDGTIKKYIPSANPTIINFVESLNQPTKLILKNDDIYLIELGVNELVKINPTDGTKTTINDTFDTPSGLTIDNNDLYITDTNNNRIVKIDLTDNSSSEFVTNINLPKDIIKTNDGDFYVSTGKHTIIKIDTDLNSEVVSGQTDIASNIIGTDKITSIQTQIVDPNLLRVLQTITSRYNTPESIFLDGSNILLVDKGNNEIKNLELTTSTSSTTGAFFVTENARHTIRKVDLEGTVSELAGIADENGTANGAYEVNKFHSPKGLVQDANKDLLIVDSANNQIRKIDKTTGIVSVFASGFNNPTDIIKVADTIENTNNYETFLVSDTDSHKIKKIVVKNPVEVTDFIGSGVAGNFDGVGILAELNKPEGLLLDSSGNIFITDSGTHCLRKVQPDGKVITEAGLPTVSGNDNGQGYNSKFASPNNLIMVDKKLYISDSGNHAIRQGVITYDAGGNFAEIPIQTIRCSEEVNSNYFGNSVSSDDKFLLISSKHTDNKGKVYVYKISGDQWTEITSIQPNDLEDDDEFGKTLLIYNNTAFIGCQNKNTKKGMVYVYKKNGFDDAIWTLLQILEGSSTIDNSLFGSSISAYNTSLFIGAPGDDNTIKGNVFYYKYSDPSGNTGYWGKSSDTKWVESVKLEPTDGEDGDKFGYSIQTGKNIAIIGAKYKNESTKKGTVYIYIKNSVDEWVERKPEPLTIEAKRGDEYGVSVGLNKVFAQDLANPQEIIIGAWKKDNPDNSGRVYIYKLPDTSSEGINVLSYNTRSSSWETKPIPISNGSSNDIGKNLNFNGENWSVSEYNWSILNESQTTNIIEKILETAGSWSSDIIDL